MNLRTSSVPRTFFKYLATCLFSGVVASIYSLVDMAVVGQYEGPNGAAAITVLGPIWVFFCSAGIPFGIGGSVLMSKARGENDHKEGNRWYTVSIVGAMVFSLLVWALLLIFQTPMLRLLGADDVLLPLAEEYLYCISFVIPLFPLSIAMGAFVRNDGAPGLVSAAVISGGLFNVFGDFFFVFTCDMGIFGAGLATAIGQFINIAVLSTHLLSKKRRFHLVKTDRFLHRMGRVFVNGFPVFATDACTGVLGMLFNNQVMRLFGAAGLSVYGAANSTVLLFQCVTYGIGDAAQPLLSVNYGARLPDRIIKTLKLSLVTTAVFAALAFLVTELMPVQITTIFMKPTEEVLAICQPIMRVYFINLPFMIFNVFSTYYFQAVMQPGKSLTVSMLRGVVISGALLYILPALFGAEAIWWAAPIAEAAVTVMVVFFMYRSVKEINSLKPVFDYE